MEEKVVRLVMQRNVLKDIMQWKRERSRVLISFILSMVKKIKIIKNYSKEKFIFHEVNFEKIKKKSWILIKVSSWVYSVNSSPSLFNSIWCNFKTLLIMVLFIMAFFCRKAVWKREMWVDHQNLFNVVLNACL